MKKEKKEARVEIVMTHEEKKKLTEMAIKADMSIGHIFRMLMREAIQKGGM